MLDPAAGSPPTSESLGLATTRPRPGTVVLDVRGEVDALTAPQLEAVLSELVSGDEPVPVVDLTGVTFLASRGLAVLIRAAHRAQARGERLRLVAATLAVRRPLEITGSDQLFAMHTTLAAATAATD